MPAQPRMRMYDDLASWWPLLSPPSEYADEAAHLVPLIQRAGDGPASTLLELGAGGGSLAFHLKHHFHMTLTDLSPGMLSVSRAINPECEHVQGDMRSLRLDREYDIVMIHDAIMYAVDPAAVQATLRTAAVHCRAGGAVVVIPDFVRETFAPEADCGGYDAPDGRGLRYLEWAWDPDPTDDTYLVDYAFLLRHADGTVTAEHDRHQEGLFSRAQWLAWFDGSALSAGSYLDPWGRDVFVARRR